MKKVILRILFANTPHFLEIVCYESEAQRMMDEWREVPAGGERLCSGHDKEEGRYFCFRSSQVASMFTMDWDKLQKQMEEARRQAQHNLPAAPPRY